MCAEVSWETHLKEPLFAGEQPFAKMSALADFVTSQICVIGIPVFFRAFSKEVLSKTVLRKGFNLC